MCNRLPKMEFTLSDCMELLFWLPAVVDVMLLVMTYGAFATKGLEWYLENVPLPSRRIKQKDLSREAFLAADAVWEILMVAYSAYGVLLPLCVWWAGFVDPAMRLPFCVQMTVLMCCKVAFSLRNEETRSDPMSRSKIKSLFFFDLPCYGGYVLWSAVLKHAVL